MGNTTSGEKEKLKKESKAKVPPRKQVQPVAPKVNHSVPLKICFVFNGSECLATASGDICMDQALSPDVNKFIAEVY